MHQEISVVETLNNVLADIVRDHPQHTSFAIRNVDVAREKLCKQSPTMKKAIRQLKQIWHSHTEGRTEGQRWDNTKLLFVGSKQQLFDDVKGVIEMLGGKVNPEIYNATPYAC